MPRSGGTLLLRLLDSHRQLHVYPKVFRFSTDQGIFPPRFAPFRSRRVARKTFGPIRLESYLKHGFWKASSDALQFHYPMYVDLCWQRAIWNSVYLQDGDPRGVFGAYFTAAFNPNSRFDTHPGNGADAGTASRSTCLSPEERRWVDRESRDPEPLSSLVTL